jgi:predicted O-methyltransferase YrrM
VGILHLDGDLYESVRDPLITLSPLLVPGGLIIFDDFLAKKTKKEKFPGARRAFEEFLEANRHFKMKISIRGNPYLVKL